MLPGGASYTHFTRYRLKATDFPSVRLVFSMSHITLLDILTVMPADMKPVN